VKIILCTANDGMNEYVSSLPNVQIIDVVINRKDVVSSCERHNFDLLLITADVLPPELDETYTIINRITANMDIKVVFIYGTDDEHRPRFVNYLISRSVYDFHVGDKLSPSDMPTLLFHPRTREDVKEHVLADSNYEIEKRIEKDESPAKDHVTAFSIPQKVISFIGDRGKGKSVNANNFSLSMAKKLIPFNVDVLLIDGDFHKSSQYRILDQVDQNKSIEKYVANIKAKSFDTYKMNEALYQPFTNIPNFYVLNGYPNDTHDTSILDKKDINYLIQTLKNRFNVIIIDTSGDFEKDYTQEFFNMSQKSFYFTDFSLDTLEYSKRTFLKYGEIGIKSFYLDPKKISLVVNRHYPSRDCKLVDFVSSLGLENGFAIDDNVNITESVNINEPFYIQPEASNNSVYKSQIDDMVNDVYDFNQVAHLYDEKPKRKNLSFSTSGIEALLNKWKGR